MGTGAPYFYFIFLTFSDRFIVPLVRDAVDIGAVARSCILLPDSPLFVLPRVLRLTPASWPLRVFTHQLPHCYEFWFTFRPLLRLSLTTFDLNFYEPFDLGTLRVV